MSTTLPQIVPVRPKLRKRPFDDPEWVFEFKYDGFRGVMYIDQKKCRIISKNGHELRRFNELCRQVAEVLSPHEVILDGEVIACDESERPIFLDLIKKKREPRYVAFDLLWLDGEDLRNHSLEERQKLLWGLIPDDSRALAGPLSVKEKGKHFFELICNHDLEGIIAKRLRDPYHPRTTWYKFKNADYSQFKGRGRLFNKKKT